MYFEWLLKGVVLADSGKSTLTSFFLLFNSRVFMTKCSILFVVFYDLFIMLFFTKTVFRPMKCFLQDAN